MQEIFVNPRKFAKFANISCTGIFGVIQYAGIVLLRVLASYLIPLLVGCYAPVTDHSKTAPYVRYNSASGHLTRMHCGV